jgi:hypothetical protein
MQMTIKSTVINLPLLVFLFLLTASAKAAAEEPKFGFRMGTGLMWAPEDKKNLDGERLYRQHYPFSVEFFYGRAIKGALGLDHIFSQEEEHTEVDSLGEEAKFTPKMRQYAVRLAMQASRPVAPWLRIHGGLGGGVFWRSYNPGWKEKSYWDKARPGLLSQAGLEVKLGPKAWIGLGWKYYAVGWRDEFRWKRGEFNRLRRMSVLYLTMSYYPVSR